MTIAKHSTTSNRIEGATDGTEIGNVGDRLRVDASLATQAPPSKIVHQNVEVQNGGNVDMEVNGSGTPQVFTAGPPAGQIWYVTRIGITMNDSGTSDDNDFGSITNGLTNGVLIEFTIDSTDYEYFNLINNRDIIGTLIDTNFGGGNSGFVDNDNVFAGKAQFEPHITLNGDDGDEFKVTIRDNLTGLDHFHMNLRYWREI